MLKTVVLLNISVDIVVCVLSGILWLIESSQEQHLFEKIYIYCNIIDAFTVNASLLIKSINKNTCLSKVWFGLQLTKDPISNKCCSFELFIHQIIKKCTVLYVWQHVMYFFQFIFFKNMYFLIYILHVYLYNII